MKIAERSEYLLRCVVHIIGRATMPVDTVYKLVGRGAKQIEAFNLCDGSRAQSEVSKKTGINQGNLSRTFDKWVENGIAFWIGEGKEARLMHIYPISKSPGKMKKVK
jgi:hypothetical protein